MPLFAPAGSGPEGNWSTRLTFCSSPTPALVTVTVKPKASGCKAWTTGLSAVLVTVTSRPIEISPRMKSCMLEVGELDDWVEIKKELNSGSSSCVLPKSSFRSTPTSKNWPTTGDVPPPWLMKGQGTLIVPEFVAPIPLLAGSTDALERPLAVQVYDVMLPGWAEPLKFATNSTSPT